MVALVRILAGIAVAAVIAFDGAAGAAPASFPPTGKIVFRITTQCSPGQLQRNLFTARTDGTDRVQITTGGPFFDLEARWSPDGGTVAVTRVDPDGIYSAVWVVGADGSDPHSVSGPPSYAELPRWSPDGRWLPYQEQTDYRRPPR